MPCALPGAEARAKERATAKPTAMPIYHLSVKPVSRSSGCSATAAAERIEDRCTGETHDYARKGGVESADIVLPDTAPTWASDRQRHARPIPFLIALTGSSRQS